MCTSIKIFRLMNILLYDCIWVSCAVDDFITASSATAGDQQLLQILGLMNILTFLTVYACSLLSMSLSRRRVLLSGINVKMRLSTSSASSSSDGKLGLIPPLSSCTGPSSATSLTHSKLMSAVEQDVQSGHTNTRFVSDWMACRYVSTFLSTHSICLLLYYSYTDWNVYIWPNTVYVDGERWSIRPGLVHCFTV